MSKDTKNILKDTHQIYCSYCGTVIEVNKTKYDFTNYIKEHIYINSIDFKDTPSDYLFLIDKDDIDRLFDPKIDGEYNFPIKGCTEKENSFNKHIFSREDIGKYGSEKRYCKEASCERDIEIPLKISLGKLTAGKDVRKAIIVKRCPNCLKELDNELGKHEMVNIGLIGSPGSGKTSIIIALCYMLEQDFNSNNFGIDKITILNNVTYNDKNEIISTEIGRELNQFLEYYGNGFEVLKTEEIGDNIININIKIESKKTIIVNFIDLAGEFWSNSKVPEIDTAKLIEKRPVIGECHKFIICLQDFDMKDNKYAHKVYKFFEDIGEINKYDCCCVINKFDKLFMEEKTKSIFNLLSNKVMRNACYFNDKMELLFNNGSYKNLDIITRDLFFEIGGKNNPIGGIQDVVFFPVSPYGFNPEGLRTEDGIMKFDEESFNRKPEPWYLDVLLIWILCKLDLIISI
jgi:hypothetical protein